MKYLSLVVLATLNYTTTSCSPFKRLVSGAQNGNPEDVRNALERGASVDRVDKRTRRSAFWHFANRYQNSPDHNKTMDLLVRAKHSFTERELKRVLKTGHFPLIEAVLEKHKLSSPTPLDKDFYITSTQHTKNISLLALGLKNKILRKDDITKKLVREFSPQTKVRYSQVTQQILEASRPLKKEAPQTVAQTPSEVRESAETPLCIICQDNLKIPGTPVTALSCYHAFHERCVKKWFERTDALGIRRLPSTCPTCRCQADAIDHTIDIATLG